jgi:hypothetical protein
MLSKTRYIIQHVSGKFINLHYEYVTSIDKAARFGSVEEAEYYFKESYYRTDKPDQYEVVPMTITYELGVKENDSDKPLRTIS